MKMAPVKSSNIDSIGHDGSNLAVKFKGSGKTYHYENVPAATHLALVNAPSVGQHFAANIKDKYKHKVVE